MKTAKEIYEWLKKQNYQTEIGEQEYRMYYDVDMPKILEQYHEARMKEECCHPFERVISAGALHNCTVCGQNIEVWKEYLRK